MVTFIAMQSRSEFIDVGGQQLHCLVWGDGPQVMLALHGYGNDANLFLPFASCLPANYTLLAIDLPHHGQSAWPANLPLTLSHLEALINNLQLKYKVSTLTIMGYSIGGRVALYLAQHFPSIITKLVLLAPDGLVFNPLYYFVTRNYVGKALFSNFLKHTKRYTPIVNLFRHLHIISEARYKFGMQYLLTPESRNFLLQVWPAMSLLIPDHKMLRAIIKSYNLPIHIFSGKYDKVIPLSSVKEFRRHLPSVHIHIVDKGHRLLDSETVMLIVQCF
jgi:pimeloyl-ACP methyl ester carboxylesterase